MRRRDFITLLGGAAALSICGPPTAARAEPPARRIGILSLGSSRAHPTPLFQALQQGLRDLGWVDGKNLAIEWRFSEGSTDPLPRLAAELVTLPVDLIVAAPAAPAIAAKAATKDAAKQTGRGAASAIPVVFVQVPDPVGLAVVPNLGRPGANITGLSSIASDLSGKRLALVKEVLPVASRIALLWNRPSPGAALVVQEMSRVQGEVGLELVDIGVSDRSELEDALAKAAAERVAAVMVIDDPVIASLQTPVVALAARHRLPLFSQYSPYVDAGGLMSYGPSLLALYRRAATYVDRILKGAHPGDMPIEQPTVFELVINLQTANTLGFDLAPTLVARADRVIE